MQSEREEGFERERERNKERKKKKIVRNRYQTPSSLSPKQAPTKSPETPTLLNPAFPTLKI